MEFLDCEAVDEDEPFGTIDGEELALSLFSQECTCNKEVCTCTGFINDNVSEPDLSATPPMSVWQVTEMLNARSPEKDLEATAKRLLEVTNSVEKIQITPEPTPKKRRNINPDLLQGGEVVAGKYVYNLTEEETQAITELVDESDEFLESEQTQDDTFDQIIEELTEPQLRTNFFQFSLLKVGQGLGENNDKGARWYDVSKTMRSDKTMQKNWIIFCEIPNYTGKRNIVPLEALLCADAEGIRSKRTNVFCMYVLEYRSKQRSAAGIKKLLAQLQCKTALIGVPYIRKPLVREWIKEFTTPLTEDASRDLQWLQLQITETRANVKFNPEELIMFCEETEPESIEILIANYRKEASNGNENAQNWIEQCGAFNNAQHCFKMWKATVRGKNMQMTLPAYIGHRMTLFDKGNANAVQKLLCFQGLNELCIINTMRKWMQGHTKHTCICIVGPGSSGKSMFAEALCMFLDGAILNVQENNIFWKQAMLGKRAALIDDVTMGQWDYLDGRERRFLDGGYISVNKKFADAVDTKLPPCIITTNYYLPDMGDKYEFLINRLTWITFKCKLPLRDGLSRLPVTVDDIAAWFELHKSTLDLD
ncbi:MAG: E1 protein [Fish-associated papillomavirus 1]|nr:MAG: E1 protein [Fish-associated papillomavirus 1]